MDTPRVRTLLGTLLHLDEMEAQLPLEVLVNLHRLQLREPLHNMLRLVDPEIRVVDGARVAAGGILMQVDFWYLDLAGGEVFNTDGIRERRMQLLDERAQVPQATPGIDQQLLVELLGRAAGAPKVQDPLVQLYRLTLAGSDVATHLQLLELELAASALAEQLILDFARGMHAR